MQPLLVDARCPVPVESESKFRRGADPQSLPTTAAMGGSVETECGAFARAKQAQQDHFQMSEGTVVDFDRVTVVALVTETH